MWTSSLTTVLTLVASMSALEYAQGGRGAGAAPGIRACAVLPATEVKRLVGLPDPLNLYTRMPPDPFKTTAAVKPGVLALAQAYAAKLR